MAPGAHEADICLTPTRTDGSGGRWTEGAGGDGASIRHISAGRNRDTVILQVSGVV
jgi:hypothetical protein